VIGARDFSVLHSVHTDSGARSASYLTRGLLKRSGLEAYPLSVSTAEDASLWWDA
jgi:hypothetical protein